jgi:subtilisin family serine protease
VSFLHAAARKRPVVIAAVTAALTALGAVTPNVAFAAPATGSADAAGLYIVQFDASPAATYAGGVAGIAATKPVAGRKLDSDASHVTAYREHLRASRAATLRKAKIDAKKTVAEYNTAFNGVAAVLTGAEVAKLRATPGVNAVFKQELLKPQTADTPKFLGLTGPAGVWAKQFGDSSRAGEGVIVGVIDTGITPESASFAALPEPRPDADMIASKWHGECVAGEEAPVTCNNKLIGARWYRFEGPGGIGSVGEADYLSPRDYNGHGTHTASTAAGNSGVTAIVNGENQGVISGMAPAARVAAYKVCWESAVPGRDGTCGSAEILAAIDDAVADGVDVINFSIGGVQDATLNATNGAFLNAAAAGVFVAASAGNTPGEETLDNIAPWITTVAASTHDRTFTRSLTLGNGKTYTGPGVGAAVASAPLADSPSVAATGPAGAGARVCRPGSLDPVKAKDKIVICERGVVGRPEKGLAVKEAGGIGMIMYNPTPNSINADFQAVPSIHVGPEDGAAIKAYAASAGATASLTAAVRQVAKAPQIASFSSSGPVVSAQGDLIKPDITAPGVDVIAAVAPPGNHGNSFEAFSGTSMASPHIAGIAALFKGRQPTWTPAEIKSALMTTAGQTDNSGAPIQREGGVAATPLDYGAGHVRPGAAFNPGLVYDAGVVDWARYVCGLGEPIVVGAPGEQEDACRRELDPIKAIDPSDLNYPSIAVGDLAGQQTITRTVRNTTNQASVYFAKVEAPAGYSVTVRPSVLTVLPRASATYTVEVTPNDAAYGTFAFGALTLSDNRGHSVRSPLGLRAVLLAARNEVVGSGASGTTALAVRPGFTGTLTAKPFGLAKPAVTARSVAGTNPVFNRLAPAAGPGVAKIDVTIPAGSKAGRIATYAADYAPGVDLDLFVYRNGVPVGASATASADEQVNLEPGTYTAYVVRFAGGDPTVDVKLNTFAVSSTAAGNLNATPASQSVTVGKPSTVTAGWSGLTAGTHYLGVIEYAEGATTVGRTLITVDG